MYMITMILPVDAKNKTHLSLSSEFDFLIMYRQTFCTYVSISIVNIEIVKFMKKIISVWVSYSINILFKALHMQLIFTFFVSGFALKVVPNSFHKL